MRYALALAIKLVINLAVLTMILGGFYGISFANILSMSLLITGISFIIGDLIILPSFEHTIAAIADFFLALIGVWFLGYLLITEPINLGIASFVSAVFITIAEVFFHRYMEQRIFTKEKIATHLNQRSPQFQTEISEELDRHPNERKK